MKTKQIITAAAIGLFTFNGFSQDATSPKQDVKHELSKKENKEAMKVAYITRELELTIEESEKFWPIYNAMEADLKALKKKNRPDKNKKIEDLTDEEVEAIMQNAFNMKAEEIKIRKSYHEKFKSVLPVKKVAKLYHIEKGMGKELKKGPHVPNHKPEHKH